MNISTEGLDSISLNPLEEKVATTPTEEVVEDNKDEAVEESAESQESEGVQEEESNDDSSSLTDESEKDSVESSESQPTKPTASEYEDWATENGFISPEDVELRIQEELSKQEVSPTIKKLMELEKAGHDITDKNFLSKLNADYSKYDPYKNEDALEVLKMLEREKNPRLSDKQIEERLMLKYDEVFSGDFDESDREYKRMKVRLEEDAAAALEKLESSKVELPVGKKEPTKEEQNKYEALVKRGRGQFERTIKGILSNNKKTQIKYGNESIEFELSDEEQARIQAQIINIYDNNPNGWLTEDGLNRSLIKEDEVSATKERLMRLDDKIFESIISKVANNKKVEGQVEELKELKNSAPPEVNSAASEKKKSREERETDEIISKTRSIF